MFEKELFNYIKENFKLSGFNVSFGFGEVKDTTKSPYVVMYVLNNDGTRQVLCDIDDYTDGQVSIQFSIYATNYSNAMYIGKELDTFLANIKSLSSYMVILNNHEVTRGFPDINTGLSLNTVTRLFTYTKIGV